MHNVLPLDLGAPVSSHYDANLSRPTENVNEDDIESGGISSLKSPNVDDANKERLEQQSEHNQNRVAEKNEEKAKTSNHTNMQSKKNELFFLSSELSNKLMNLSFVSPGGKAPISMHIEGKYKQNIRFQGGANFADALSWSVDIPIRTIIICMQLL